jgi:hypothetical protein
MMKWRHEQPFLGAYRERRKFAWLPFKTSDGYTVWLETYGVDETFMETKNFPAWCPTRTFALFFTIA